LAAYGKFVYKEVGSVREVCI